MYMYTLFASTFVIQNNITPTNDDLKNEKKKVYASPRLYVFTTLEVVRCSHGLIAAYSCIFIYIYLIVYYTRRGKRQRGTEKKGDRDSLCYIISFKLIQV